MLALYFRQCSLLVTAEDLAVMAATLANGGVNPVTGVRALTEETTVRVLSVMTTCGMYDFSGEWMYRVGLPAKSGVSGGVLAVARRPARVRRLLAARRSTVATACAASPRARTS